MQERETAKPIAFAVDDVLAVTDPIWSQPLAEHLLWRFQRKVLFTPEASRLVVNVQADYTAKVFGTVKTPTASRTHSFIGALHTAFSQHRPLTITPDCIWLVIAQGFSHHINQHYEALRSRLVRHQGKRTLQAGVTNLSLESFRQAVNAFSTQIREASDPVLYETLVCDFSTTTADIRTASEIVLLDAYKDYFEYTMEFICGIPRITVTGTPADWRRIRDRFEVLATYDLEWWASRVRPILDEFIRTAEGNPNCDFWKAIFNPRQTYGNETVTGWAADLFPYLGDPPHRRRNNVFEHARHDWLITKGTQTGSGNFDIEASKGAADFASGLSSVPVTVGFPDGSEAKLDFVGGFLAVQQNRDTSDVAPLIGWCVTERPAERPI